MKKILLLVLLGIFTMFTHAQQLKFSGVSLGISIEDFDQQIQEKGFKPIQVDESPNFYTYTGIFDGDSVTVRVVISEMYLLVSHVFVYRDFCDERQAKKMMKHVQKEIKSKYVVKDKITHSSNFIMYKVLDGAIAVSYEKTFNKKNCFRTEIIYRIDDSVLITNDNRTVFEVIETAASFPGDMEEFFDENIVYPENARKNRIEGTVHIQFVVNKEGAIVDPIIYKSSGCQLLDEEALRVVKLMPNWIPASQRVVGRSEDKSVSSKIILPIKFRFPIEEG